MLLAVRGAVAVTSRARIHTASWGGRAVKALEVTQRLGLALGLLVSRRSRLNNF